MSGDASTIVHFEQTLRLSPPSLAAPAILSFFTIANIIRASTQVLSLPWPLSPPRSLPPVGQSEELDCEWEKCLNLGQLVLDTHPTRAFRPGSMEGVWEGIFTVRYGR